MIMHDFGRGEVPAHQHKNGGGWVAETASVDDTCFVGPYAAVFDNAVVRDNARIDNYARVYGNAAVCQTARVYGDSQVCENVNVMNNARVSGRAKIYGSAKLYDSAHAYDDVEVYENAILRNFSEVYESAKIYGNAVILDSTKIYNDCIVTRQPIALSGKFSDVTSHIVFTDNLIIIGCIVLPPSVFKQYGYDIFKLFKRSFTLTDEESKDWIDVVVNVAKFHKCADRDDDIKKIEKNKVIQRILAGETQDRNINKGAF